MKPVQSLLVVVILSSLVTFSCGDHLTDVDLARQITAGVSGDHKFQDYHLTKIDFDSKGNAWIAAFDKGLIKYDNSNAWLFEPGPDTFDQSEFYDIAVDNNDIVWIGTSKGLVKFDGREFTTYNTGNTIMPRDFVSSVASDRDNNIWLSSSVHLEGGLMKFNGTDWELFTPDNSDLPDNLVHDIVIADDNKVWIGTGGTAYQNALTLIDGNTWTIYDESITGIPLYYISGMELDTDGTLITWIDWMLSSSINYSRPSLIVRKNLSWSVDNPHNSEGNPLGYVQSAAIDSNNRIWATVSNYGTILNHIVYQENEEWFVYDTNEISIFDMAFDDQNRLYLVGDGLLILDI